MPKGIEAPSDRRMIINNTSDADSKDVTLGGVFCGSAINEKLLAEELTERRFVIRVRKDANYAMRVGEVCGGSQYGGGQSYQATRNNGEHVAIRRTLLAAALTLL